MRGMSALLIERGEISKGTSKNSHQNLVSGMRYVVKDASVAQECRQENEVMARICPDLITGKKNFFVGSRSDYVEQAIDMARRLGIPFQEYTREEARKEVAGLGPEMEVALETDDRNIDIVEYCHRCCRYGRYCCHAGVRWRRARRAPRVRSAWFACSVSLAVGFAFPQPHVSHVSRRTSRHF